MKERFINKLEALTNEKNPEPSFPDLTTIGGKSGKTFFSGEGFILFCGRWMATRSIVIRGEREDALRLLLLLPYPMFILSEKL